MKKKIICYDFEGREFEVETGTDELIFIPSVYGILIEN